MIKCNPWHFLPVILNLTDPCTEIVLKSFKDESVITQWSKQSWITSFLSKSGLILLKNFPWDLVFDEFSIMLSDFIPFLSMAHLYSWQCCVYALNFRHDSTVMIRPSWFDREVTKQYSLLPWISYRNQSTQSKSYFNGSLNVSLVIQKKKTVIHNLFSFSDNRQYYKGVVGLRGNKRICWITSLSAESIHDW